MADSTSLLHDTRLLFPLAAIGLVVVSYYVYSFVRLLLSLFVLPGKSLETFGPRGSWALITGSSDGIGLEFATQLAAKGYNVLLVSRTASKLTALASTLSSTHSVRAETLAMDFAAPTTADWQALARLVAGKDVSVLINNVGLSHAMPVPFAETPSAEMRAIVDVNVHGTLNVTSLVLPGMLARGRGLVLTMGSFGGLLPTPLLATYSGSKAFLQQWSSALGAELAPRGVRVELVQSYLVTSAMSKVRKSSALVPTPRAFVRATLAKVGRSGGAQGFAYSCTPWWSHGVMQWGIGCVGFMSESVGRVNLRFHEGIRKRALRKAERDAKKL